MSKCFIHSTSSPVFSCWPISITGDTIEVNIYYVGDMYEVESRCGDFDGNETETHEYFVHLSDAVAYAETV